MPAPVRTSPSLALALAAVLGPGCGTTDIHSSYALYDQGHFEAAAEDIVKLTDEQSRLRAYDTIWLLLERGKVLQDAGRFADSNSAFQKARTLIDNLSDQAVISVSTIGNDIGAMQTDDRQTDYVGTGYDRILLHSAMALNFAMLGELESAVANVNAQLGCQQEAIALNEKRLASISERERADAGRKGGMQGDAWNPSFGDLQGMPDFQSEMKRMMGLGGDSYADYTVPYGYAFGAIVLGAAGRFGQQEDMARLASDPRLRSRFQETLGPPGDEVIVLFENGLAPARFDASFGYFGPNGPTKIPVPRMQLRTDGRATSLRIDGAGGAVHTQFVDSVDGIVGTDFKNALPVIWFRAMVQVMIKEMETWVLRRAADNNFSENRHDHRPSDAALVEFGALMVGAVARNIVEPDLRSWRTLPGEHQMARFPRPQGPLTITVVGSGGQAGASSVVELPGRPGPVLVYVRSTSLSNVRCYVAPLVHGPSG